jgi:hypothetical protein
VPAELSRARDEIGECLARIAETIEAVDRYAARL